MADLNSDLQASISALGTQHTNLVQAVRDYTGGSVASATNDMLASVAEVAATIKSTERNLLGLADRSNGGKLPSMLLDFASQTYFTGLRGLEQAVDPHKYLNVSRATSKWVMGPQGRLVEVPPNTLAYEYDPVTGEPLGVLIEESRTNLLLWNEVLNEEVWSMIILSSSYDTELAPDGSTTADVFEPGKTGVYQSALVSPESEYVFSVWVKLIGASEHYFGVYDSTHSEWVIDANSLTSDAVVGEWKRVSLSFTTPPGCEEVRCYVCRGSVDTGSQAIWRPQLEEGTSPSSCIHTTDSPVTRAADRVYRDFGNEATGGEFTVYASGTQIENPGTYFSITGPGGYAENGVRVGVPTNGNRAMWSSISGPSSLTPFPDANPGGFNKVAVTVTKDDVLVSINGAVDRKPRNKNTLVLDSLNIGQLSGDNNNMNGPLSEIIYYPYALTEAELQELTANG